jgi:hypothetical protein
VLADHVAWFVLDVVDQVDLRPFLAADRADGHGRVAYQARMLLGQDRSSTPPGLRPAPRQPATPLRDRLGMVKRQRLV